MRSPCLESRCVVVIAADFGASTGGFTDCLLQRGAARVYAIDVGYGQLATSCERIRVWSSSSGRTFVTSSRCRSASIW